MLIWNQIFVETRMLSTKERVGNFWNRKYFSYGKYIKMIYIFFNTVFICKEIRETYKSQKYINIRNFEESTILKLLNRKFRYFYTRIKFPLVRKNK